MQAFALTVIEFDADKFNALTSELKDRGFVVATVSIAQTDPVAEDAVAAAPALAVVEDAAATAAAGDVVEEKPFKCPACGATFDEQVECTNEHPAEQTLPTSDVNAGTSPSAATTANGDGTGESAGSSATDAGGAGTSTRSSTTEEKVADPSPPGGFPA